MPIDYFRIIHVWNNHIRNTTYTKHTKTLAEDYFERKQTNKEQIIA